MTMTAKTSKRIHFEPEEEEDEVESGVEDAALVESESAEALLSSNCSSLWKKQLPYRPYCPSLLDINLDIELLIVPVDLSIVPPLSAELGTKPPANFRSHLPNAVNFVVGESPDMTSTRHQTPEVKVKLFPETFQELIDISFVDLRP